MINVLPCSATTILERHRAASFRPRNVKSDNDDDDDAAAAADNDDGMDDGDNDSDHDMNDDSDDQRMDDDDDDGDGDANNSQDEVTLSLSVEVAASSTPLGLAGLQDSISGMSINDDEFTTSWDLEASKTAVFFVCIGRLGLTHAAGRSRCSRKSG